MITFYKFKDAAGQEHGPISESALRGLHQSGRITDDTPVLDFETNQWRAYRDLGPDQAPPFVPPPAPPRPPAAQVSTATPTSRPSPWTPPPTAIRYSESKSESAGPDHWDWIIFASVAGLTLLFTFLNPNRPSGGAARDSAYQAGQTCGTVLGALIFPALFLLLRRWWGRLVSALGCFGFWALLGILAAIALPALLGQRQRARMKAGQPMALVARTPAPWLTLQLPGDYTEVPVTPPNAMVAVARKATAVEGEFQVEVQLMEMAPGYRVIPETAIQKQKEMILANPLFAASTAQPAQPVRYGAGRGQSFEFTMSVLGRKALMRSIVLAFPGDSENPTRGIVLVMHGQGPEPDVRAQMERIAESIRYIP